MSTDTIDHNTLARLVEAQAVRGAIVIGEGAGWKVRIKYGMVERSLAATRSREVRIFRKLETLVGYLRGVGISRFDMDASNYDPDAGDGVARPDASAQLKSVHETRRRAAPKKEKAA